MKTHSNKRGHNPLFLQRTDDIFNQTVIDIVNRTVIDI